MSIELKMPALSPTMEKGTLAKWLVAVGDLVNTGDLLAEIETDKATMEFQADDDGIISSIIVAEGTDDVSVGTVIATIARKGEKTEVASDIRDIPKPDCPLETVPLAHGPAAGEVAGVIHAISPGNDDMVDASPLAQRIAAAHDIALESVTGSGVHGRILMADLGLQQLSQKQLPASVRAPAAPVPYLLPANIEYMVSKLTNIRKMTAQRLAESKQTVPHFYLSAHCTIDPLLKLRHELNASLSDRGVKLSVSDMLIKAMALAMTREPEVNVQFAGDEIYHFKRVDIGVAVAVDGGLITPVIRDVMAKSLSAIAQQSRQFSSRARDGELTPEEYQGGTASISNLGMFGIDEMFPVINPPQAFILGIGSGSEKPWKVEDAIALAHIMTATGSFDHRAIDGAAAARFMSAFRDLIEHPFQLIC